MLSSNPQSKVIKIFEISTSLIFDRLIKRVAEADPNLFTGVRLLVFDFIWK